MFVDPCIIVQFIKKNPTKCNNVSKFYYSIFIWSSTCFGRHTAHHQEPKAALAVSGFAYMEGCWTSWASYKYGIIKFWYIVASCWILLYELYYDARIQEHQIEYIKNVPDSVHQLRVQQPFTYEKPEAASAVLGSWWWAVCRPKHVELQINVE